MCAQFCKDNIVRILKNEITKTEDTNEALYETMKRLDREWTNYAHLQYEQDIEYIKELDESGDYSYETIVDRSSSPSDYFKSGTTATVMVIEDGYCVYYCWVGDSRAILCRNGVPKRLTFEHSLDKKDNPLLENEIKRISDAGGEINVENNGLTRIYCDNKSINMTRAIGDIELKKFGIISEPSTCEDLPIGDPKYSRLTRINHNNDSFICIVTDGVSGPLTAKEIVENVHSKSNAKKGARHLVDTALLGGSQDNCTAIVIPLGAWGKYKSPAKKVRHLFIGSSGRY